MMQTSDLRAYTALTIAAVVWGGSIVAQKLALGPFSAVEVSVLRGLGALAILVPLWWWEEGERVRFSRSDLGVLFLLGVAVLGNHLLTLVGLRYISASAAGIIIGASPAITGLLSSLLLGDVPLRVIWMGCAVSFVGVAVVSGADSLIHVFVRPGSSRGPVEGGLIGDAPGLGALLVLLGLVSWALYTIGGRRAMDKHSPLTINWTTLLCSVLLQIPLLAVDQKIIIAGAASVPLNAWLAILYLVVFATALGQQAWLFGVKGIGPSRAGVFVNVIPVSAVLLSAGVLGEPIGHKEVAGISLIVTGVWLVNRQSRSWAAKQTGLTTMRARPSAE